MNTDKQKYLVYSWEQQYVAPFDTNIVPFEHIKGIVDWIWKSQGLKYPPLVSTLPATRRSCLADATRVEVRFPKTTFTWVILHELAHAMTSNVEDTTNPIWIGKSNLHGSLFMGVYIQLLSTYLKMDKFALTESAEKCGLRVKLNATTTFAQ